MSGGASSGHQGQPQSKRISIYNLDIDKAQLVYNSEAARVLMRVAQGLCIPTSVWGGRPPDVPDVINTIMDKTGAFVIGVERVENRWLEANFKSCREHAIEWGGPVTDKELYHGTGSTLEIARKVSNRGLDPMVARRSKFGLGVNGTTDFLLALKYAIQAAEQSGRIYQFIDGEIFLLDKPEQRKRVRGPFFKEGVQYMQLLVVQYRIWFTGTENGYKDARELDTGLAFTVPESAGEKGQIFITRHNSQSLVKSFIWLMVPLPQTNPPRSVLPANPFGGARGSAMQQQLPKSSPFRLDPGLYTIHTEIKRTSGGDKFLFKVGSQVQLDLSGFTEMKGHARNVPSKELRATVMLLFKSKSSKQQRGQTLIKMEQAAQTKSLVDFLRSYTRINNGLRWEPLIRQVYKTESDCFFKDWIPVDLIRLKLVSASSVSTSQVAASGAPSNGAAAAGSGHGKEPAL